MIYLLATRHPVLRTRDTPRTARCQSAKYRAGTDGLQVFGLWHSQDMEP